jgi:hypothetical protein
MQQRGIQHNREHTTRRGINATEIFYETESEKRNRCIQPFRGIQCNRETYNATKRLQQRGIEQNRKA